MIFLFLFPLNDLVELSLDFSFSICFFLIRARSIGPHRDGSSSKTRCLPHAAFVGVGGAIGAANGTEDFVAFNVAIWNRDYSFYQSSL